MGMRVPPLPLPPSVVAERIKNGARTMREIDPAFAEWCDAGNRLLRFQVASLFIGMLALAGIVVVAVAV